MVAISEMTVNREEMWRREEYSAVTMLFRRGGLGK
jgi:hypothetical protein